MEHLSYANRLPFEIWRECFMLVSGVDHKALATTCHFFRDICLSFIFKSISYSSRSKYIKTSLVREITDQIERQGQHIERFGELSRSLHATLVRKFTLRSSLRLRLAADTDEAVVAAAKKTYEEFVGYFVEFIPAFVNLREVRIEFQYKKMDKKILVALSMIPDLDELSFHSVRFGVHLLKPRIKVRRLVIDNTSGSDSNPNPSSKLLDMFSGERLERLTAQSWSYAPKIFRALTEQGTSNVLNHLSFRLEHKYIQDLYLFLASCPNLESIHVDFGGDPMKSLTSIPRSSIPRLTSFIGPEIAVKAFIPGRPVRKARIGYESYNRRLPPGATIGIGVFHQLSQSTGPLADLDIQAMDYNADILALVATHFPKLARLRLNLSVARRAFIDEDPHAFKLDKVMDENPKHQANDVQEDQPVKRLLPVVLHFPYLNALHWVALGRIDLPPGIEMLCFHRRIFPVNYIESELDDEHKFARRNIKAYTLSMVHSIFDTLSVQYPGLRSVVVGDMNGATKKLSWSKLGSGKWTYSEYY